MIRRRHVDWMHIPIEKLSEDDCTAEYRFSGDVYEPHPSRSWGSIVVGRAHGILMIDKQSGDVVLVEAMPGDEDGKRFSRAARKIRLHWEKREFPDTTRWACG